MKYCTNCGNQNSDAAQFCINCGSKFENLAALASAPKPNPPPPLHVVAGAKATTPNPSAGFGSGESNPNSKFGMQIVQSWSAWIKARSKQVVVIAAVIIALSPLFRWDYESRHFINISQLFTLLGLITLLGVLFGVYAAKGKRWSVIFLFLPIFGASLISLDNHDGFFLGPLACWMACFIGGMAALRWEPLQAVKDFLRTLGAFLKNTATTFFKQQEPFHRHGYAILLAIGSSLLWFLAIYAWGDFYAKLHYKHLEVGGFRNIMQLVVGSGGIIITAILGLRFYYTGKGRWTVFGLNLIYLIGVGLMFVGIYTADKKSFSKLDGGTFLLSAMIFLVCLIGGFGIRKGAKPDDNAIPQESASGQPAEITFACSSCNQNIACDGSYRGVQIQCPTCQADITVPG